MNREAGSTQTLKVWPFLISRNETLDYRPILVPEFLSDDSGMVQDATKFDEESNVFKISHVTNKKYGNLTYIYHSVEAKRNNEILVDAYNRPIYRIEGFVFRDEYLKSDKAQQLFGQVESEIDQSFRQFWKETEPKSAKVSEPVMMAVMPDELQVSETQTYEHHPSAVEIHQVQQLEKNVSHRLFPVLAVLVLVVLIYSIGLVIIGNKKPVANAGDNQSVKVNKTEKLDGTESSISNSDPMVSISSEKPKANAGENQFVKVSDTVTLEGRGSAIYNSDAITYKWSFFDKPSESQAALDDLTSAKIDFVVDVVGTFTVQLIVNDGNVNSEPSIVTVEAKD